MEEGRSGNQVPAQYGTPRPFFTKATQILLPTAFVAALLGGLAAKLGGRLLLACRLMQLLGAAYAFGSNVWLLIYGPKMYRVCTSTQWLGKEAFSTIQAALFPDFFAFQTAGCVLALGGYIGKARTVDAPAAAIAISLGFGLINFLYLGPKTTVLMFQIYQVPMMDDSATARKKKFGMVHGISMLLDLAALISVAAFLCLIAGE